MRRGEAPLVAMLVVKGEERLLDREPRHGLDEMRPVGGAAELAVGGDGHTHLGLQLDHAADGGGITGSRGSPRG